MSGKIRQAIGLTKKRLVDALKDYQSINTLIDPGPDHIQEADELYEVFETIHETFERLRKYVARIQSLHNQWNALSDSLIGPEKERELQVRKTYIETYGEYLPTITQAEIAVEHLRNNIGRFRIAVAERLQLEDFEEEPISEGTLSALPQNNTVFVEPKASAPTRTETPILPLDITPPRSALNEDLESMFSTTKPLNRLIPPQWSDNHYLPRVVIPEFDGNPSKWKEFFDLFEAMVDKRQMEGCLKLFHLKGALKGEAAMAISSLGNSNDDYPLALNTLKELFGDSKRVAHRLRAEILHYQAKESNALALYKDWAKLNQLYAQLQSLGDQANNTLMAQVIETKFPRYILQKVIKAEKGITPSGDQLLKAIGNTLREEANLDRRIADNKGTYLGQTESRQYKPENRQYRQERPRTQHYTHAAQERVQPKSWEPTKLGFARNNGQIQPDKRIQQASCGLCGDSQHRTYHCHKYSEPKDRKKRVTEKGLCYNCLKADHQTKDCPSQSRCRHCTYKHHSSICFKNEPAASSPKRVAFVPNIKDSANFTPLGQRESSHTVSENKAVKVDFSKRNASETVQNNSTQLSTEAMAATLLMTTNVKISGIKGKQATETTLFLDNGSTKTYITEELADLLRLKPIKERVLNINTFGDKDLEVKKGKVYLLRLHQKTKWLEIEATAMPKLTCQLQVADRSTALDKTVQTKWITPQILLGIDYAADIEYNETSKLPSGFTLCHSSIGTFIYGKGRLFGHKNKGEGEIYHAYPQVGVEAVDIGLPQAVYEDGFVVVIHGPMWAGEGTYSNVEEIITAKSQDDTELISTLSKFWAVEHLGVLDDYQITDDARALKAFQQTVKRTKEGRYICSWPWKETKPNLGNNFARCKGRLIATLKRLQKTPELFERYEKVIKEQLELKIIEIIDPKEQPVGLIYYIPHQHVVTPDKATTKFRIVYDASCKTITGKSLNDFLYKGPNLMPNMTGILVKFRITPIPMIADVEKAFLQLELAMPDRDVTRFLWIKDKNLPAELDNLITFRFARVPFGVVSSPFLLAASLDMHLQEDESKLASNMRINAYVDNILIENDTPEQAISAYAESREIFQRAKMNLREFQSSDKGVKEFLKSEGISIEKIVKILGVPWDIESDTISLADPKKLPETDSKRAALQLMASFYDPLGLISPMLLKAKLFIQELWAASKNWDQALSEKEITNWHEIRQELLNSSRPTCNRRLLTQKHEKYQLHVFCDASNRAYSAVAYLRPDTKASVEEIGFLIGKSRIKPIKDITIPIMELLGMLIASTLAKTIQTETKESIKIESTTIWSDSQIVLAWIQSTRTRPTFIHNRVVQIRKNVPTATFQYVPTKSNPADWGTRELSPKEREKSTWLQGPDWLKEAKSHWPNQPEIIQPVSEEITMVINERKTNPIEFIKFHEWKKLVHTIIVSAGFIVKRFEQKGKPLPTRLQFLKNISDKELDKAIRFREGEMLLFHLIQREYPPNEAQISDLKLIKDSQLLYRCTTRLLNSSLHPDTINPIFLPEKSHGTKLYINHVHEALSHASSMTTLSSLRMRVWIPKARVHVKAAIKLLCLNCRPLTPFEMAKFPQFPQFRVTPQCPFKTTGLDYAGPFKLKYSKSETSKGWICLFTCLTSRAIHLELVFDLTPMAFLQALRRFVSRRGAPDEIWSDNATTFKASANVLMSTWRESEETQLYRSTNGIKWHFIPEASPWQGGAWERLVGLTKTALKKAIGKKQPTLPEFMTVLVEIEAVVNSRPLVYVPSGENINVIRPIDCIQPNARLGVPRLEPFSLDETWNESPSPLTKIINLWRQQQTILDRFWDIWQNDYLLSLAERKQDKHKQGRSLTLRLPIPGEVVVLKEEGLARGKWKLAKVLEVCSPRKIKIRLAGSRQTVTHRPPNLLLPLEITQDSQPQKLQPAEPPIELPKEVVKPRRSARLAAKTYFIELTIITMLFPSVVASNNSKNCTPEDCAPWRWHCCTPVQRTGTYMWIFMIITGIAAIINLVRYCAKPAYRLTKNCWKRLYRPTRTKEANKRAKRMYQLIATTSVIMILSQAATAEKDITTLQADTKQCTLEENTDKIECLVIKSIQLSIKPVGQTATLNLQLNNDTAELLKVKTNSITYHCHYKHWYYTRDFETQVESVHRCRQASQSTCFNDWCENTRPTDDVVEFSQSVRSAPGHSHCTRSCQCVSCGGCFLCEPSCLFWRLYALPKSTTIYSVGSCPTWELTVQAEITMGNRSVQLDLRVSEPQTVENVSISLSAATTPQLPIMSSTFVSKENSQEAAIMPASNPDQPTAGSVGTFQCSNKEAATQFNCYFPEEICACSPSDFNTICQCNYRNPVDFFQKEEHKLPLTSGPIELKYVDTKYQALLKQQTGLLLQIDVKAISLSQINYATRCSVIVEEKISGCYSCHQGAQAKIKCSSKHTNIIRIECGESNHYTIPCDNQTRTLVISTSEKVYKEVCTYKCSKTSGKFTLQAVLESVEILGLKERQIGQVWSKPASEVPIEKIMEDIMEGIKKGIVQLFSFIIFNPFTILCIILALTLLAIVFRLALKVYFRPISRGGSVATEITRKLL